MFLSFVLLLLLLLHKKAEKKQSTLACWVNIITNECKIK